MRSTISGATCSRASSSRSPPRPSLLRRGVRREHGLPDVSRRHGAREEARRGRREVDDLDAVAERAVGKKDAGRLADVAGGVVAAPLLAVVGEETGGDAAEDRLPAGPVVLGEGDLEIGRVGGAAALEDVAAEVNLRDDPGVAALGVADREQAVADAREERGRVFGRDDAVALAAAEVEIDLAGAERVRLRLAPVGAAEQVAGLGAVAEREEAVLPQPLVDVEA